MNAEQQMRMESSKIESKKAEKETCWEKENNNTKSMASDLILPDKWTKWHFEWNLIVIVLHWNRAKWKGSQKENIGTKKELGIKAIANEFIRFEKVQWILVSPWNDEREEKKTRGIK